MILWNTGRFDDIRLETEPGRTGLIVRFVVTERRVIRSIDYPGAKSVTVSEILDRFKERKVGLSVESQYDPNKVQRAAVVLKEFLAERGRQYATVDPQIEQIPPSSLKVSFMVNEGPKVKVGNIDIVGNQAKNDRWVIRDDEELASPSGFRTRSSSRTSSPRPSTAPSSMKTRSASARPIRMPATFRRRRWKKRSISSIAAARAGACR